MINIHISVITAVYNRADTIHRVFESLEKSTYRNFELIIVDDGSTDNIVEIVEKYVKLVSYPVTFKRKENGGKHTAINLMYEMARGEYIFSLDSDDELMPEAMKKALMIWETIPPDRRNEYWCVCGRNIYNETLKMIGKPFPLNINENDWNKAKKIASKISGDKMSLQKLEVVKKYKFPEHKNVKFVTERIVWNRIDNDYKQYYTNEVFGNIYIDANNRLSNSIRNRQAAINIYFNCMYQINNSYSLNISIREYIKLQIRYYLNAAMISKEIATSIGVIETKHKIFNILISPIAIIMLPKYRSKYNLKEL